MVNKISLDVLNIFRSNKEKNKELGSLSLSINKKRGQLTLFIILSIIVVFLIVIYYFYSSSNSFEKVNPEVRTVYDLVVNCVSDVSLKSLEDIGVSGGYFDLPNSTSEFYIPYYSIEGNNLVPSVELIEKELVKYNENMLYFCFQERYSSLSDYEISGGEINVVVDINKNDKVYFKVHYPFSINKANNSYYFDETFLVEHNVRLYTIHSFAEKIIYWNQEQPYAMCINCISDEALKLKLYVNIIDKTESDVIYYIVDPENQVNNEPYRFYFVIKPKRGGIYDPFE